jgi:hypothetical protein
VVITGPLDFLTTSRSGESGTAGGVGGAEAACSTVALAEGGSHPDNTVTAPIMALRMTKVRRSIPVGVSAVASSGSRIDLSS